MPKKKKITYAFVDSQNLNLSVISQGWSLDFKKFYIYLKDKYKVKKVYLFIGYVPGNQDLYTYLQEAGYIVIFKPTLEYKKKEDVFIKGNVDAELVLQAMIQYPNYDQAIIISGDGDFHCLIEYLQEKKKLYKIIIPNSQKFSALLRKFRQYFIYLDQLSKKIGKAKGKGHKKVKNKRKKRNKKEKE